MRKKKKVSTFLKKGVGDVTSGSLDASVVEVGLSTLSGTSVAVPTKVADDTPDACDGP